MRQFLDVIYLFNTVIHPPEILLIGLCLQFSTMGMEGKVRLEFCFSIKTVLVVSFSAISAL